MLGILITARLGSTRLPNKHLLEVGGKPIMGYLLDRIQQGFSDEIEKGEAKVIIATSAEPFNLKFKQFAPSVSCFYGDIKNIPLRHLQAAYNFGLDYIVAVDGDDILCSVQAMKDVAELLKSGEEYVTTKGLPFGLNAFGYSTEYLESALQKNIEKVLETGWGRIFNEDLVKEKEYPNIEAYEEELRFTLDYEEDLNFFRQVIEGLKNQIFDISDSKLISHVLENEIYRINKTRIEEYWSNFNNQKENHG